MRIASLDLGSNSFLCLIADTDNSGICKVISDEVRIVRLSEGVQKTGLISVEALQRAKEALSSFKESIIIHKVNKVVAVTTAVARQATNAKLFLDLVAEFDIPLKLISGSEEAEITYLGAVSGLSDKKDILVIDIGGGSTEIIFNKNYAKSFNFGVVRLKEKFNVQYPIVNSTTMEITKYIDGEVADYLAKIRSQNIVKIVAVAGTPTTLAAMEIGRYDANIVDGYILTLESLEVWYAKLSKLKPEEIVKSFYIDVGRADVIAIGALILIRLLIFLNLKAIEVSIRGVRYGVLLKALEGSCQ
jgi:exopolyphosphatase/guanosine-5'-triphosphate,3'-diphosphate pyrophosphatase